MKAGLKLKILSIGFIFLCLWACKEQATQPLQSDPYARWKHFGYQNYTFDQTRTCYCINGGEAMRVTVRSDTVSNVMRLSDSSMLSPADSRSYLTIDSLFGLIHAAKFDSVVIRYHATYGYTERLDIDPQAHPWDGGVLYVSANLRVP